MRAVMLTLSLLLVAGCGEHYRYPCQDPANWKKEECNRPACEADGMCWDKLSGVEVTQTQVDNVLPEQQTATEQPEENNGE